MNALERLGGLASGAGNPDLLERAERGSSRSVARAARNVSRSRYSTVGGSETSFIGVSVLSAGSWTAAVFALALLLVPSLLSIRKQARSPQADSYTSRCDVRLALLQKSKKLLKIERTLLAILGGRPQLPRTVPREFHSIVVRVADIDRLHNSAGI